MLSVAALVVFADQLTKSMIGARLEEGASTSGIGGVRFKHVKNRRNPWRSKVAVRTMTILLLVLTAAALGVANLIDRPFAQVALGALIGGATGNLIDGISRNAVTDFIDLRVWPVFNFADAAIVAGATLLLWNVVRSPLGS